MSEVFVVIQVYPHYGFDMIEVHSDEETAKAAVKEFNESLPEDAKPVHDDWGLVEGTEYKCVTMESKVPKTKREKALEKMDPGTIRYNLGKDCDFVHPEKPKEVKKDLFIEAPAYNRMAPTGSDHWHGEWLESQRELEELQHTFELQCKFTDASTAQKTYWEDKYRNLVGKFNELCLTVLHWAEVPNQDGAKKLSRAAHKILDELFP